MILLALRSKDALTLMLHHVVISPSELRDGVTFVGNYFIGRHVRCSDGFTGAFKCDGLLHSINELSYYS